MCHKHSYRHGRCGSRKRGHWGRRWAKHPPINLEEKEDHFELQLFASGLDKDRLSIWVKNDHLHITYRAPREDEDEIVSHYRRYRERKHPDFERSFDLNGKILVEKIKASYADGVLTLILPKNPDTNPPVHTVEVE